MHTCVNVSGLSVSAQGQPSATKRKTLKLFHYHHLKAFNKDKLVIFQTVRLFCPVSALSLTYQQVTLDGCHT